MPARQSFVIELVGHKDLMNAIVLNSTIYNGAKIIGPSIGGIAIAKLGLDVCFFLNTVSYIPVIVGLTLISVDGVVQMSSRNREGIFEQIKTGLQYVFETPEILIPMMLMTVINVLALNFTIILPLYAKNVFNIGAGGYGFLMSANGIGAFLGSIVLAIKSRKGPKLQALIIASAFLCIFEISLAVLKSYLATLALLVIIGVSFITFITTANTLIQTKSPNHLRGRIMSIYALIFSGLTPIGSLLTGTLASSIGVSETLGIEAVTCLCLVSIIITRYNKEIKEIINEQYC